MSMIFRGSNGQTVAFRITGYQFPADTSGGWDANWLRVYVRVETETGGWESVDPSLTTWELARLAGWFGELSRGGTPQLREMTFTEPDLGFRLLEEGPGVVRQVRIAFDRDWDLVSGKEGGRVFMDMAADSGELARIARELNEELEKFPERRPAGQQLPGQPG